jgi:bifunctional aspartokinase / homoserine dehydrogenase 1
MIVMKFGGSSLANAEKIRNVYAIVTSETYHQPAVVLSAMKGVTDALLETAKTAEAGNENYKVQFQTIRKLQRETVGALFSSARKETVLEKIDGLLEELELILTGVELVQECSPRSLDLIASFGERLNCTVFSEYLLENGHDAWMFDTRDAIVTNDRFGSASVKFGPSYRNIAQRLRASGGIAVITGFIARSEEGITTTLGRNGSDYTASLIGAAVEAEKVEIWTDVDGVLSANPKLVENAFVVKELNFQEAMELSYFGAEVIHPSTMIPAVEKNISIYIKNTMNPTAEGTRISKEAAPNPHAITGIASIGKTALINIEGGGMIGVPGIASRVFKALAAADINIIMISQASSEHSICIVTRQEEAARALPVLQEDLQPEIESKIIQHFDLLDNLEIVAIIGENMKGTPGISGKLFSALGNAGINVLAIAQGSSERNISFVISAEDTKKALTVIHKSFLENDHESRRG